MMTESADNHVRDTFRRLDTYRDQRGLSINTVANHLGLGGKELERMRTGGAEIKAEKAVAALMAYMSRPREVEELQKTIDKNGLSRGEVAKALGMSDSKLSQVLRGLYPSYGPKDRQAIDKFLWLQEARAGGLGRGNFQKTRNVRIIFNACEFALVQKSCAIVIGEPGCGKTIIARRYRHENPGTILLETYTKMPPTDLLRRLHRLVFGTRGKKVDKGSLFWALNEKLKGAERLIVVDEANQLNIDALQTVRNLSDHAGLGLVLLGTDLLWRKLYEYDPARTGEFAQLFSRAVRYNLVRASRRDSDMLVQDFIKNPSETILQAFHETGNKNHRAIVKLVGLAHELAKEHGGRITPAVVEEASNMLIFGIEGIVKKNLRRHK